MTWNPDDYLSFADLRLRPARDLLARIPASRPERVVDLGCGAGNVTRLLRERWPDAHITGVDNSPEMLAKARADGPRHGAETILWETADLNHWTPTAPVDVLFSNAALHWLDDHAGLFPRLLAALRPGGVLAVQMPDNYLAPSHQVAYRVARQGPWAERLAPLLRAAPLLPVSAYYDLFAPLAAGVDIWHTRYQQILTGDNPVADWTRGSLLVPLLDALPPEEAQAFEAAYRGEVRKAYPPQANGKVLFPFERLFMVVQLPA